MGKSGGVAHGWFVFNIFLAVYLRAFYFQAPKILGMFSFLLDNGA